MTGSSKICWKGREIRLTGPEWIHYSPLGLVADDSLQLLIFCEVLTILVSTFFDLADVAQLVEQPIRNRQVTSSTLVVGSILSIIYK